MDPPTAKAGVWEGDLLEEKQRALQARMDRAERVPTTGADVRDVLLEEYARAAAALDEVIDGLVCSRFPNVPAEVIWSGVRLALAKLGKEDTCQYSQLERRLVLRAAYEKQLGAPFEMLGTDVPRWRPPLHADP